MTIKKRDRSSSDDSQWDAREFVRPQGLKYAESENEKERETAAQEICGSCNPGRILWATHLSHPQNRGSVEQTTGRNSVQRIGDREAKAFCYPSSISLVKSASAKTHPTGIIGYLCESSSVFTALRPSDENLYCSADDTSCHTSENTRKAISLGFFSDMRSIKNDLEATKPQSFSFFFYIIRNSQVQETLEKAFIDIFLTFDLPASSKVPLKINQGRSESVKRE